MLKSNAKQPIATASTENVIVLYVDFASGSQKHKVNKPVFDAHNYNEIDQIVNRLREEMSKFSRTPPDRWKR
jgi:hypothetical protein